MIAYDPQTMDGWTITGTGKAHLFRAGKDKAECGQSREGGCCDIWLYQPEKDKCCPLCLMEDEFWRAPSDPKIGIPYWITRK